MALNRHQLDLDALIPEPSTVILGGKEYELLPPTMADLVFIGKLVNKFEDKDQSENTMTTAIEALSNFLPKLIRGYDSSNSLTLTQATAIIEFIFTITAPPEARVKSEVGETSTSNQKKTTD